MNLGWHFDTFGYVVLREFFGPSEVEAITRVFDVMMPNPGLQAQFADHSVDLMAWAMSGRVDKLVTELLGKGWLYKGSDGNVFERGTPWHRDYLINTRTCKILTYLDPSTLDVIPGSHFVDGPFAHLLNQALTWPEPPTLGGFAEKDKVGNDEVPCVSLSVVPGDVIVFNHNIIHRANVGGRRRLLGLHYAAEFNDEIRDLTLIEMRTFALERCYGPHVPLMHRTAPFHALRDETKGKFSGSYTEQSGESIEFGRRLIR